MSRHEADGVPARLGQIALFGHDLGRRGVERIVRGHASHDEWPPRAERADHTDLAGLDRATGPGPGGDDHIESRLEGTCPPGYERVAGKGRLARVMATSHVD